MKTPEEYYHSFKSLLTRTYRPTEISYQKYFVEILAEAQKEAYNQAIEDAAASVEIGYTYGHGSEYVNKESILKLKK